MTEQVKVFLSYRRADTQHVAGRIADRIGERFELFVDIDTIPPGVDFTDYVRRAVGSCDVLLAFIGSQWATLTDAAGRRRIDDPQDWVVEEIRVALQRGVRVIPVLVDDAVLPTPAELPESLRPLVNRQAVLLRHSSFSADAARLIAAVDSAGAQRPAAAELPAASPPEPFAERWDHEPAPREVQVVLAEARPTRRRWLIPAAGSAAAVLALLVVLVLRPWAAAPAASTGAAAAPPDGPAATSVSSRSPTSAPTRDSVPAARTTAELRVRLPASLRDSCRRLDPEPPVLRASLLVAVQCQPPKRSGVPAYVFYFSYANAGAATRAFRGYYAPNELDSGDCSQSAGEQTYARQGARPAAGVLRCYRDNQDMGVFAWTNDELSMVASVADPALSFAQLKRWWETAGPSPTG